MEQEVFNGIFRSHKADQEYKKNGKNIIIKKFQMNGIFILLDID